MASLLSLSLTCTTFYHLYWPQSPDLSKREKTTLLLGIEKDTATVYFCHFCVSLHPWGKESMCSVFQGRVIQRGLALPCQGDMSIQISFMGNDYYRIDYPIARALMNGHLYGDNRHVSTTTHSRQYQPTFFDDPKLRYTGNYQLRIIENELFLFSDLTAFDVEGNAKVLR